MRSTPPIGHFAQANAGRRILLEYWPIGNVHDSLVRVPGRGLGDFGKGQFLGTIPYGNLGFGKFNFGVPCTIFLQPELYYCHEAETCSFAPLSRSV